jgi:hypothetical protein
LSGSNPRQNSEARAEEELQRAEQGKTSGQRKRVDREGNPKEKPIGKILRASFLFLRKNSKTNGERLK